MATIDAKGFTPITTQEIIDKVAARAKQEWGEDFPTSPESVFGVHTGIQAAAQTDIVQLLQWAVNQQNRKYAEGVYLDYMGKWVGLDRLTAAGSVGYINIVAPVDYTVVSETEFTSDDGLIAAAITETYNANPSSCYEVLFRLTSVGVQDYSFFIDGSPLTYTSTIGQAEEDILSGIRDLIVTNHPSTYSAVVVDNMVRVKSVEITNELIFIPSDNITLEYVGNLVRGETVDTGKIEVDPYIIVKPLITDNNIFEVYNPDSFILGRDVEDDESFRQRLGDKEQSTGTATLPAISSKLSEVVGVTKASVRENSSWLIDASGRPRKSYQCYVAGGLEADIAQAIWDSKPAGIELWGDLLTTITDEEGEVQPIRFSRFEDVFAWIKVTLSLNTEETLPTNYQDLVKASVVSKGTSMKEGEDFKPNKFTGSVYSASEGFYVESIEIAVTGSESDIPVYQTALIPVTVLQNLVFDSTRVEVDLQ